MRTYIHRATVLAVFFMVTACGSEFDDEGIEESVGAGAAGSAGADPTGDAGSGASEGLLQDAGLADRDGEPDAPDAQDPHPPDAPVQDPACPVGWADCDGDSGNGCEVHVSDDSNNCGACHRVCDGDHASVSCEQGVCILSCDSGFADCDGDGANGCEADLGSVDHCLACGTVCEDKEHASATCGASGCGHQCEAGWEDCDQDADNGCEAQLSSNADHCGACGASCPSRPNAAPACNAGQCDISCLGVFENCDGQLGNGCEANVQDNASHCGGCGKACGDHQGVPSCSSGVCAISCYGGWEDCDGINANGCETFIEDINNCGACGNQCGSANGWAACWNSACNVFCNQGFADCDGAHQNGCEVDLGTDPKNCGTCGRDCLGGVCEDGLCVASSVVMAWDFAVDGGFVYAAFSQDLTRVPGAGGVGNKVAEGLDYVREPVVVGGSVYFFNGNPLSKVQKAPTSSQIPFISTVVQQAYPSAGLTFDNGTLYWRASDFIAAVDANAIDGKIRSVAIVPSTVAEFHVLNGWIYWVGFEKGEITRVPTAGGKPALLVANQSYPVDMALDGSSMYWANRGDGTVKKASLSGSSVTTLATGKGVLETLTVDGDTIYFANGSEIWRMGTDGAGLTLLANNQILPDDIAVDGDWVYWLNRGQSNWVKRVAK